MATKQNPTRRQHYVQRAYLAYFVAPGHADKDVVWVYDKRDRDNSPRLQSLIDSALEKDIYTMRHSAFGKPDVLEQEVFTRIENEGFPALKILAEGKRPSLTSEIVGRLSGYLVTAHLRVPRNIDAAKQLMEGILIESFKEMSKDPKQVKEAWERAKKKVTGKILSEEKVKDLLENPEKHVGVKANHTFALLLNLQLLGELTRIVASMRWTVLSTPDDSFFVTSDSPLVVFARTGSNKVIFGGGFALPQVEIHFPISPRRCLFVTHKAAPEYRKISKLFVNELNRRCIAMAERFVFAPYKSNRIEKLVTEFANYSVRKVDRARLAEIYPTM